MRQLVLALIILTLGGCTSTPAPFRGAILPHHNLVGTYIDQAYEDLYRDAIEHIILISPNHENLGDAFIQTTDQINSNAQLDSEWIAQLTDANIAQIESINFESEHGIMVHLERIEKIFPRAKVLPIILKWRVPKENLDQLIQALQEKINPENTLIIASIDFSHFVTEETAQKNDQRTIQWLKDWSNGDTKFDLTEIQNLEKAIEMDTKTSTAMDSPETFYTFTKLMGDAPRAEIWKRTSSGADFGVIEPMQITSHLFVKVR